MMWVDIVVQLHCDGVWPKDLTRSCSVAVIWWCCRYTPSGYIRLIHGHKDVRLGGPRSQVVDLDNDSLVVIDK